MNYYGPRQIDPVADRPDAGKWRFTCMNDGRVWPVGHCATDCPGHDDDPAAREHYRDYLLDTARFEADEDGDQQRRCEGTWDAPDVNISGLLVSQETSEHTCGQWTTGFAETGPGRMVSFTLCHRHRNRETLARLVGLPGDSFGSY